MINKYVSSFTVPFCILADAENPIIALQTGDYVYVMRFHKCTVLLILIKRF